MTFKTHLALFCTACSCVQPENGQFSAFVDWMSQIQQKPYNYRPSFTSMNTCLLTDESYLMCVGCNSSIFVLSFTSFLANLVVRPQVKADAF